MALLMCVIERADKTCFYRLSCMYCFMASSLQAISLYHIKFACSIYSYVCYNESTIF